MAIRRAHITVTEKLYDNLLHESEVIVIILRTLFIFFGAALYLAGVNIFPPDKIVSTLVIISTLNIIVVLQFYLFKNGVLRRLLTLIIDFSALSVLTVNNFGVTVNDSSIFAYTYVLLIIVAALWFSVPGSLIMSFSTSVTILFITYLQGGGPSNTYIIGDTMLFQVCFLFVVGLFAGYIVDIQIREREHTTRYRILLSEYEKRYKNSSSLYQELLPKEFLDIKGYDIYARLNPVYDEGGGDIYYMNKGSRDGEDIVLVADVTGKDARGVYKLSLFTFAVKTAFRLFSDFRESITEINKIISDSFNDESFVAATFVNIRGENLDISSCGNELPILMKSTGEIVEISSQDMLLGIDGTRKYNSTPVTMEEGDVLILLTDGMTEARNVNGDEIDIDTITAALREGIESDFSAKELCDLGFHVVEEFSKNALRKDDMTIMVLKRGHL